MLTSVWRRATPGVAAAAVAFTFMLSSPVMAQTVTGPKIDLKQTIKEWNVNTWSRYSYSEPFSPRPNERPHCSDNLPTLSNDKVDAVGDAYGEFSTLMTYATVLFDPTEGKVTLPPALKSVWKELDIIGTWVQPAHELLNNHDAPKAIGLAAGNILAGKIVVYTTPGGAYLGRKVANVPGAVAGAAGGMIAAPMIGTFAGNKIESGINFAVDKVKNAEVFLPQDLSSQLDRRFPEDKAHPNPLAQGYIDALGIEDMLHMQMMDSGDTYAEAVLWEVERRKHLFLKLETQCTRNLELEKAIYEEIAPLQQEACAFAKKEGSMAYLSKKYENTGMNYSALSKICGNARDYP